MTSFLRDKNLIYESMLAAVLISQGGLSKL